MDRLVVQVGSRHGRVAEVVRSQQGRLSIGRGFGNDLVLTDMHVAPNQITLMQENGAWTLAVLDETNPVLLNGSKVSDGTQSVKTGDEITVGRTRLYLFADDHPVEQTRKLVFSNWLSGDFINPFLPVLVLFFAALFDFMLMYFESSTDLDWEQAASDQLLGAVIIVLWAGFWAFIGRILRHQHHFGLQVVVTVGILVLASVSLLLFEYLIYPFHDAYLENMIGWVVLFATIFLLVRVNLAVASNLHHPGWMACFLTIITATVIYGFNYFDADGGYAYSPYYSDELKPPVLGLSSGQSQEHYFAEVETMMKELEASRQEKAD